MNEIELKRIWVLLTNMFDMGSFTYDQFKQKMSTPDGRKGFFEKYGQTIKLGTFDEYEKKLVGLSSPEVKTVTTKYVTQYPNDTKPNKAFKSRPCDENVFPWTYGCKNRKIGQMNDIYFGDTYGDIYGNNLYTKLESLGSFKSPGEKDGQISEKIYNMTLQDSLQENKKIVVKETVKKVLKERLNKK